MQVLLIGSHGGNDVLENRVNCWEPNADAKAISSEGAERCRSTRNVQRLGDEEPTNKPQQRPTTSPLLVEEIVRPLRKREELDRNDLVFASSEVTKNRTSVLLDYAPEAFIARNVALYMGNEGNTVRDLTTNVRVSSKDGYAPSMAALTWAAMTEATAPSAKLNIIMFMLLARTGVTSC